MMPLVPSINQTVLPYFYLFGTGFGDSEICSISRTVKNYCDLTVKNCGNATVKPVKWLTVSSCKIYRIFFFLNFMFLL